MAITNEELLQKATLTSTDFGGAGQAPLSLAQSDQFIELMSAEQVMLPDVHTVKSTASKWQESILDFASRVMRSGVEATRLSAGNQVKPNTGIVEISTVLLRAEVPISDEVMEDNTSGDGFASSVERTLASRAGFDIEDLMLNGDTASADAYLALLDGWLKQARGATGHVVNVAADGQDYQTIFKKLLNSMPDRHKRMLETDGRFYAPKRFEERYRDILATRGTPLGDMTLSGTGELRYQGILIKGVPSMAITAGTPDTSNVLLVNRNNLYAGYRRQITMETWRDPREGATSFVVTARVDSKIAVPDASAIATSVDVSI